MEELKVLEAVRSGDYNTIDRDTAKTPEERQELMHKAFFADVYLTSFNAMSEDGVLINIDGMGNRVADCLRSQKCNCCSKYEQNMQNNRKCPRPCQKLCRSGKCPALQLKPSLCTDYRNTVFKNRKLR